MFWATRLLATSPWRETSILLESTLAQEDGREGADAAAVYVVSFGPLEVADPAATVSAVEGVRKAYIEIVNHT